MDGLTHPSTKFPWLILALAIFYGPTAIYINSYQAEGGWEPKTWAVGLVCQICAMVGCATWWFFFIPLLLPLCAYIFSVFFGYKVMQKSQ